MKKITLLLAMLVVSFGYSQTLPIDFEESDDSNIFASVGDGGTFNIIDDDDNAGESVGEFSGKVGGANYDHINVPLTTSLDIAATNTISFRVKQTSTEGTTSHLFKLQPGTGGTGSNKQLAFTTELDVWKDVSLTFSGTGTYNELIIFFDFESTSVSGTYLIDDIVASSGTPAAAYDLPFDFETSPVTSDWTGFEGAGITVEAVAAPQTTGNSSTNLAKIVRNGGQAYAGVVTTVDTALDFSTKSTITARIWTSAPIGTKVMFKTENAADAGDNSGEKDVFTTKTGEWEDLVFDFAGVGNTAHTKLVIIPDNGNVGDGSATSTFFFDDIIQEAPVVSYDLPFDFETSPVTSDWTGFEGAGITVEAVAAPQTTGNSSTNLAKIVRNGGQAYAGVVTAVDTPLDFSTKSTITARIWTSAPIGTKVMFKTENAADAGDNSGEKDVFTTKTGEWEDLVFDFAGVGSTAHTKLVIIPDNGNVGDGSATSTFFFDDIIQEAPTAASQTITVSIDVSADPGGVNIVTPTVSGNWAEYAATVDPNNANKYSYTFAEGVTSAEFVWKVYGTSAGDVQESLTSLVGGGAIENNLAATLPTGNGINTDYSTYCNRTVASDSGDFVAPTFVFNSFRQVGVTYTELVLTADSGDSYAIDYSVNDYSEYHGPGATDNGDGTYTVIVDPSSAFTYLWYNITTSTQEDLSACDSSNRDHAAGDSEADSFGVCPTTATGNSVTVATSQAWNAYVNAFNVSDGTYAFGFGYTVSDLRATPTTTSMTLEPNTAIWTANATDAGWFDQGAATQTANKYIEALSYIEDATLANEELTFSGNVSVSDLGDGYTVVAFIKTLTSGYSTVAYKTADISSTGDFTVTATADEMSQAVIQYGFAVTGPLADPADTSLGSVVVGAETLRLEDTKFINVSVYPNPSSSNWNFRTPNTVINSVEVFNLLGKRVASQRSNNSTETSISTQGLSSGIYIARITTEQGAKSVKLIKN